MEYKRLANNLKHRLLKQGINDPLTTDILTFIVLLLNRHIDCACMNCRMKAVNSKDTSYTDKKYLMFDPLTGSPYSVVIDSREWRLNNPNVTWLYNPWTGELRDGRDVLSDREGFLLVPPVNRETFRVLVVEYRLEPTVGYQYKKVRLNKGSLDVKVDRDIYITSALKLRLDEILTTCLNSTIENSTKDSLIASVKHLLISGLHANDASFDSRTYSGYVLKGEPQYF